MPCRRSRGGKQGKGKKERKVRERRKKSGKMEEQREALKIYQDIKQGRGRERKMLTFSECVTPMDHNIDRGSKLCTWKRSSKNGLLCLKGLYHGKPNFPLF